MTSDRPAIRGGSLSGSIRFNHLLFVLALCLLVGPWAIGFVGGNDSDLLAGLPPANEGAFEGGPTGTYTDAGINNAVPQSQLRSGGSFDLPTGGKPSPMFGAQPFTQQMLRFEEFGTQAMPTAYVPGGTCPSPLSAQDGPPGAAIDAFLTQPLWPRPIALANDTQTNPWKGQIESFLGRPLNTPPAEGRAPGMAWAHQRWDEFPPRAWFKTAMTGARTNSGLRNSGQRHGYTQGEFGPGGLYHNTIGAATFDGTTAGIPIRFHPNMPIQDPHAVWTFDGTFPPKLLMARYGETTLMRIYNLLPIDPSANMGFGLHTITIHEHNGHTPAESDGYTQAFFFPGQYYDYRWPLELAGHDTINTTASDPRAGTPDGAGGIFNIQGDWRETMSTHWFHDHMLDFTAQNVYKGSAAMMNYYSSIDRGNEAINDGVNLKLPSGTALDWGNRDYDVNLLVADKAWDSTGQLWFNIFNLNGFMGDQLLANWLYKPHFKVRARRYRFRILNGSVSRYIKVALIDQAGTPVPFHLIANDGNIMEHAIPFDGSNGTESGILPTQGIAERYDIVVDFSSFQPGDKLYFVNMMEHKNGRRPNDVIPLQDILSGSYQPVAEDQDGDGIPDRWTDGDPCVGKFLELQVESYSGTDPSMDPSAYEPGGLKMIDIRRPTAAELAGARHRTFEFGRSNGTDQAPWTIKTDGGSGFGMDPRRISAAPNLGSASNGTQGQVEIWHLVNNSGGWSHPVHIHFEEGIILKRGGQDPPIWEKYARKDLYRIGPMSDSTSSVEVAIRFREFSGTYMEHCHNTQHEDHAMLLRWDVEHPGQMLLMPTPMPTWDGVGYVNSVALPTFRTGDGVGPSWTGK